MANPYDQFDEKPAAAAANPYDQFDETAAPARERGFLGASAASGGRTLVAAGARILDALNPFTTSEEEAAVLYKNDPEGFKRFTEKSAAAALSRFAREQTELSKRAMEEVDPAQTGAISGKPLSELKYATLDPEKAAYLSPTRVAGDVLQSLPSTLALAVAGYLTRGRSMTAAAEAEAAALARGATAVEAKAAGQAAAMQQGAATMAKAGAAGEGAVGYGVGYNQARDEAADVPQATLEQSPQYQQLLTEGYTPETARALLASQVGRQSGVSAGVVDAATNLAGGAVLGKIIGEGGQLAGRVARGAATEGLTETVQSAGEQAAQNVAMRAVNPDQALSAGVGEAAAAGLVVGGVTGGAVGGVFGRSAQAAPAPEERLDQTVADLETAVDRYLGSSGPSAEDIISTVVGAQSVDDAIAAATAATDTLPAVAARKKGAALATAMDRQAVLAQEAATAGTEAERTGATEQAAVALQQASPAAQPIAQDYADLAPMDARTAQGRLRVLRDQAANEGGDALGLVIAPHPATPGKFAIAKRALPSLELPAAAPAPMAPTDQNRLESAALAGTETQRKLQDEGRQIVLTRALKNIEERGGVASPAEAQIVAEAGLGRPFDRVDESLGPQPTMDQRLTQATGIALDKAPRESAVQSKTNTEALAEQQAREAAGQAQAARERAVQVAEGDARMASLSRVKAVGQQLQDLQAQQAAAPQVTEAPDVEKTLELLKKDPALRSAEEKLVVDTARKGLSPQQFDILQRAATNPPSLSATERLQLRRMREGDLKFSEGRSAEPGVSATAETDGASEQRAGAAAPRLAYSHAESKLEQGAGSMDKNQHRLVRNIARIFGKKVQVFTSERADAPDGYVRRGDADTIYLNAKSQTSHLVVFGHELMHQLRRDNAALYEKVVQAIKVADGANLDVAGIRGDMEEFTSDLLGNRFREPEFWANVFNQLTRAEAVKLGDTLRRTVDRFVKALRGMAGFDTDAMVANLEEVKGALTGALAQYARERFDAAVAMDRGASVDTSAGRVQKAPESVQVAPASPQGDNRTASPQGDKRRLAAEAARRDMGMRFSGKRTWQAERDELAAANPYFKGVGNKLEFQQRLQWLSEGMLRNHMESVRNYKIDQDEIATYRRFRGLDGIKTSENRASQENNDDQPATTAGGQQPGVVQGQRAAPSYGTAREGATAVTAWHFSQTARPALSSSAFGTGLKGSAREQFLNATDPRSRQRIYFYIDKGNGIHPESGVGGAAHEVRLNNVYDGDKDALKLKRGNDWQAFESAVLDAGFDGYLYRQHNLSGAVVLLGPRVVPVAHRGAGRAATQAGGGVAAEDSQAVQWQVQASGLPAMMEAKAARLRDMPAWKDFDVRVTEKDGFAKVETRKKLPTLNVGLSTQEVAGGGSITEADVRKALSDLGVKVADLDVHQSDSEQTAVVQIDRPLTAEEGDQLSRTLQQEAIVQRMPDGSGELYGPQAANWGPYNPEFFVMPDGSRAAEPVVASAKRRDLFPGEFANKRTIVPTRRVVSSKGDTAPGVNVNSAGQQIAQTKQGLANFWNWFGDSQATDDQGRPLVLYHSTNTTANTLLPGLRSTNNYGLLGDVEVSRAGVFLTPDREFSQEYLREGSGQNVMPLYARIENALDLRSGLSQDDEAKLERAGLSTRYVTNIQNYWELFDNADDGSNDFVEGLKKAGYDGAIFREGSPTGATAGGTTYVVFAPDQLKSALGNRETFSRNDPDVTASAKRDQLDPEIVQTLGRHIRNLTPSERAKLRRDTAQRIVRQLEALPPANEFAAVAYAGRAKRGWYEHSAYAIEHVFGGDGPRFAALLAALSPQTSVEANLYNTLSTWKNWVRAGRPTSREAIIDVLAESVQGGRGRASVLGAWINNSVRALASEDPSAVTLSGPKVNSFMLNLRGVVDEVTNDTWMANFALVDQTIFSGKLTKGGDPGKGVGYLSMNARVREAAKTLTRLTGEEWTPAEVQETIWSWAKTLYESASINKSAVEILRDGELTADLINSTPDFRTLFHDETNEQLLRDAGLGDRVDSLRARAPARAAGREGSDAEGQAAPFARDAQQRYERRAAQRLDELRRRGLSDEEVEEAQYSEKRDAPEEDASAVYQEVAADEEMIAALETYMVSGDPPEGELNDRLVAYLRRLPPVPADSYLTFYRNQPGWARPWARGWASWTVNEDQTRYFGGNGFEVLKRKGGQGLSFEELGRRRTELTGEYHQYGSQGEWLLLNDSVFRQAVDDMRASEKRIFDDSGRKYTPEQLAAFERVGFTRESLSLKERLQLLRKDLGKKLAQGIFDQFAPIKELDKKAYGLARLSRGSSGAFEALLKHGKLKLDPTGVFDADTTGGAIDVVFKPLQNESGDFLRWVAANRAERLMAEGRENLFSAEDIAAIKTLDSGTADFDYTLPSGQVTRDRTLIYRDSLKKLSAFNKNVLDMAEQSGLIDGEARKLWESEFYVPFYRVTEEDGLLGMSVKDGLARQQAIKQLKGGKDKLNADLMSNMLMNWAGLIDASAKNRAALATMDAAVNAGAAVEAPKATVEAMGASINNRKGVVWTMDGGAKRYFLVEDPYLLTAISSLQYAGLKGPFWDALTTFKHWLTVGVTASPAFKIRNLVRDSISAIAVSPLSGNVAGNLVQGFRASNPATQTYVSSLAGGGLIRFGTMLEGREADRVRQLVKMGNDKSTILDSEAKLAHLRNKLEGYWMAYNEIGNRGEELNRSALYDQLIKQGVPKDEATLAARDLMDFSLQGTWAGIRILTQVVPFFNARLQGMYKLGRGAAENPKRFGAVVGAVLMASLALMAAYSDDEDWKKREDWDRNTNWWFKVGGVQYRIPKPFEVGALATLAERGLELWTNEEMTGKRYAKNVRDIFMDNLSMNPIPQAIKPIIDLYANKDSFTGRPIENMAMQRLQEDYRFDAGTSMGARAVSSTLQPVLRGYNLSPVQIDHLVRGYFGWLGSLATGAVDMVTRPFTDEPTRPTRDYWRFATQGIASEVDGSSSYYVSALYDQAKEVEKAYATWRSLLKAGKTDEAKDYFEDKKESITRYSALQRIKAGEAKFNELIRLIERSATLTPDEKKARINAIRKQQSELAKVVTGVR